MQATKATPELILYEAGGVVKTVTIAGPALTLGRAAENDLSYPADSALSRHHLVVERDNGGLVVRDLGSKNGTLVNGTRINGPRPLEPGDRITAGHLTIQYGDLETVTGTLRQEDLPELVNAIETNLRSALDTRESLPLAGNKAVQALIRAGQELSGHRPLAELFDLILELASETVGANRGVLMTLDHGGLKLRSVRGEKFEISATVRAKVIQERSSVLVLDALTDREFRDRHSIVAQKIRSLMAVPLQTTDHVIGMLYVDTVNILQPFTREDLNLLTVLANVAAIRIEQVRLAEVEQAEQIMARELSQAAEIQRQMLPALDPDVPGIVMAGRNLACRSVGGDYFDYVRLADGRLGIAVADVAGKGLAAALLMPGLQARLQVLAESLASPVAIVKQLNRGTCGRLPGNRFVTFFLAAIDPATGAFTYCNAGHNPPLLVRASGSVEQLATGGIVLGLIGPAAYEEGSNILQPGDTLVLFSDGVSEAARPSDGEQFGEDRLAAKVSSFASLAPGQMLDRVLQELHEWCAACPFEDDVTLVIVRKRGESG